MDTAWPQPLFEQPRPAEPPTHMAVLSFPTQVLGAPQVLVPLVQLAEGDVQQTPAVPLESAATQRPAASPALRQAPPVPQFQQVASAASSAAAEVAEEKQAIHRPRRGRAKYMKFWRTLHPPSQKGNRIPAELLKQYKKDAGKKDP